MNRADRNPGVRQCLGFCTADFLSSLAYDSAEKTQTLPNLRLSISSEHERFMMRKTSCSHDTGWFICPKLTGIGLTLILVVPPSAQFCLVIGQKWQCSWARWWNTQIKVNPTQVHEKMNHPVHFLLTENSGSEDRSWRLVFFSFVTLESWSWSDLFTVERADSFVQKTVTFTILEGFHIWRPQIF